MKSVSQLLAESVGNFIQFSMDLDAVKVMFYRISRFPGVIGCIDCTHKFPLPLQEPDYVLMLRLQVIQDLAAAREAKNIAEIENVYCRLRIRLEDMMLADVEK